VVAVALHDGYEVRPEVAALLAVTETDRWREEEPFTTTWTEIGNICIVAKRSRFEVDLNRPKEKAVYLKPEEAWGLRVFYGRMVERRGFDAARGPPWRAPVYCAWHARGLTVYWCEG
jgi:hypothetical protein